MLLAIEVLSSCIFQCYFPHIHIFPSILTIIQQGSADDFLALLTPLGLSVELGSQIDVPMTDVIAIIINGLLQLRFPHMIFFYVNKMWTMGNLWQTTGRAQAFNIEFETLRDTSKCLELSLCVEPRVYRYTSVLSLVDSLLSSQQSDLSELGFKVPHRGLVLPSLVPVSPEILFRSAPPLSKLQLANQKRGYEVFHINSFLYSFILSCILGRCASLLPPSHLST